MALRQGQARKFDPNWGQTKGGKFSERATGPEKKRGISSFGTCLSRSPTLLLVFLVAIIVTIGMNIGLSMDPNLVDAIERGPEPFPMQFSNTQRIEENRKKEGGKNDHVYFLPKDTIEAGKQKPTNQQPDFGNIQFKSLKNETGFQRQISSEDAILHERYRSGVLPEVNSNMSVYDHYDNDPPQDVPRDCRRPSWVSFQFPTCNSLHELTFDRPFDNHLQRHQYNLVGEGTFRQTYRLYQPQGEGFVLKILIYKSRFDNYVKQQLYIIPFEALIMERLTASPRITDIYGFCGTTSILEQLPHEVNEIVQAGSGRANQTLLDRLDNVYPQNDLTPYEKVVVARDMAESLADLHGFTDGVIVHGDNHIDQFLADSNGLLKLGDFNLATILEWNDKKGEYCKREREPWRFRFRAPEEIGGTPFDEKVDVFTLGNSIYSLITGLRPFYHDRRARVVCAEILNGTRGFVDPRYRKRSFLETKLLEIMDLCWEHDENKREDIFSIVSSLRQLLGNGTNSGPFVIPKSESDIDSSE